MIIQLNHPGKQKPYKLGNGYRYIGNKLIREWNNDNGHYRKFIKSYGYYIDGLDDSNTRSSDLLFWGEWEGNSFFYPLSNNNQKIFPNGIHIPFHSTIIRGIQNTDPYIFGDDFKYCICKQRGCLLNLGRDDLIIFGTTMPTLNKFYIDTVYVVKDSVPSKYIQSTSGSTYSQVYKEETLEQLHEYLKAPVRPSNNRIYHSKTWWDDSEYFSFVPCKDVSYNGGFERFYIDLNHTVIKFSLITQGVSYIKHSLSPKQFWIEIVKEAISQGFKLGIRFEEPKTLNQYQTLP
jgi:hypothetical protein